MDHINKAAKAAYESIEGGTTSRRTPWEMLSAHWREYWCCIARAALGNPVIYMKQDFDAEKMWPDDCFSPIPIDDWVPLFAPSKQ